MDEEKEKFISISLSIFIPIFQPNAAIAQAYNTYILS